ncbi:MAG: hypothetical protein HQ477_13805 [Chloroflexi bacterium]|nr:hypothetical protein [Chloroflexota bacterium]
MHEFPHHNTQPNSPPRSQHERKNPGRPAEPMKRSDAFKKSELAKRNSGSVESGVFRGRKFKGFEGVQPRKQLWMGSKQRRLFT